MKPIDRLMIIVLLLIIGCLLAAGIDYFVFDSIVVGSISACVVVDIIAIYSIIHSFSETRKASGDKEKKYFIRNLWINTFLFVAVTIFGNYVLISYLVRGGG